MAKELTITKPQIAATARKSLRLRRRHDRVRASYCAWLEPPGLPTGEAMPSAWRIAEACEAESWRLAISGVRD